VLTRWRHHRLRWKTSNCSLLLIYRPREGERLSWPGWLTCSERFTHVVVTRRLQAKRRTGSVRRPKTGVPPTVLHNQLWISLQLDILCTSAVKQYYAKSSNSPFTCHLFPRELESVKAKNTCYGIIKNTIWIISYSGQLSNKNAKSSRPWPSEAHSL